jgi:heme A synthase
VKSKRFATYAWFVLAFTVLVVLWGAFVRASGSGAGCGNHWPLCNGVVVPRAARVETLIEFSHRMTSGLSMLFVLGLIIWGFRLYGRGQAIRWGLVGAGVFILMEALIGAGLVLFGLTADNDSRARAISMALHLINTFLLMASLAYTAWLASGHTAPRFRGQGPVGAGWWLGLIGIIFLGMSGAITALGDTLFPAESFSQGLQQDFGAGSHILLKLRVWHPFIAVGVGLYVIFLALLLKRSRPGDAVSRLATLVITLVIVQLVAGAINVALLAPIWMQLLHLFLACSVWITFFLLGLAAFAVAETEDVAFRIPAGARVS